MAKISKSILDAVNTDKFNTGTKKETLINPDTVPSGATAKPADNTAPVQNRLQMQSMAVRVVTQYLVRIYLKLDLVYLMTRKKQKKILSRHEKNVMSLLIQQNRTRNRLNVMYVTLVLY